MCLLHIGQVENMAQNAKIISCYAADTSGVCSALYELGGMIVVHDASGCNSTYTTHDEPRWYDTHSMMYISGLTENDAVMGNDEKFVSDLCQAANELSPRFVAICASALPAMVGIDMEAITYEVESQTGIPCFTVRTNAMQSYITGAGNAFLELAKRFTKHKARQKSGEDGKYLVNILGLTPLDFPLHGTTDALQEWLESNGHTVNSYVGMHNHENAENGLDEIVRLGEADVSLVVSSIGMPLARYLYKEYGIPYVVGTPFGRDYARLLEESIRRAVSEGRFINTLEVSNNRGRRRLYSR